MKYSFIVPVFNRPDEVDELLRSLCEQTFTDFEVVIVEDGSQVPCKDVVEKYADRLPVRYFAKDNSGPGQTRNYGVERAEGDYVLILDSDVVVPSGYLQAVQDELEREDCDAFGGPDRAHDDFTPMQKAINYAMTSFFTTGGIRGGKKKLDKFYPRSFNMGVRREVYNRLGGFSEMRFGEDIDFSTRLFEQGCRVRLFPEAWVWHKRRTDLKKFFKQVHNSGIARINLEKPPPRHAQTRASAAERFHGGLRSRAHCEPFLSVVSPAFCYLCRRNFRRLLHPKQEPQGGSPERGGLVRPAHRLRHRLPALVVAPLR